MGRKGSRAGKQVGHAVAAAEENIIWKATKGIFRPVKTDAGHATEKAAARQGRKIDVRAGHPTHRTESPRLTNKDQEQVAEDLGYTKYNGETRGAQQDVYYKKGGDPPYISYDRTTHGANRGNEGPDRIPWKGADDPKKFGGDDRRGTFNPEYDNDGNIVFKRGRR